MGPQLGSVCGASLRIGRDFLTVRGGPLSTSWAENTAAPLRFGLSIHELFGAHLSRELTVEIAVIFLISLEGL